MPYSSNSELPEAVKNALPDKAQTIYRKAFNSAYETYNKDEEKAIATAWTAVKTKYEKKNDKWVLIAKKVVSGGIDFNLESEVDEWIPVAKVGQEALLSPDNIIVTYDKDGLTNYANNANAIGVTFNHGPDRKLEQAQISNLKFEDPYLYMQISEQIRAAMKDPKVSGCSIEGIPQKIEEGVIKEVEGTYLSLMEYPQLPACKLEEGCGVVSSSILEEVKVTSTEGTDMKMSVSSQVAVGEVETTKVFDTFVLNNAGVIVKIGTDSVYGTKKQLKDKEYIKTELMQRGGYYGRDNLQFYDANGAIKIGDTIPSGSTPVHVMSVVISKQEPELMEADNRHLKQNAENIEQSSRGGDVEGMDKEEPITYTGEQVKAMVASAVGEVETNLKNQREVDIKVLKEAEDEARTELETKHEAELKETAELALRKAKAMGDFKTKLKLSEEAEKGAEVLPVEALEFFNGLNISLQGAPNGVTSGAPEGEEKQEEKLEKIKTRFHKKLGHGKVEG